MWDCELAPLWVNEPSPLMFLFLFMLLFTLVAERELLAEAERKL